MRRQKDQDSTFWNHGGVRLLRLSGNLCCASSSKDTHKLGTFCKSWLSKDDINHLIFGWEYS